MIVMKRLSYAIVIAILLTAITPAFLFAQTSNGTIAGSVVDPRDNTVPKATVIAISPDFGVAHDTQTDSAGTYRLESLQPDV